MRQSLTALLIAVVFFALAGCGQTGPLYMPKEETPKPPAAPAFQQTKES